MNKDVVIIGAGPAGLTAAYLLLKNGYSVHILETDPHYVGGLSKTIKYKNFLFDIGGHRFFSKSKKIEDFWTEILPEGFLTRQRSSRIFYAGKYFSYPIKGGEALMKLGPIESIRCVLSLIKATIFPIRRPKSFQDWVTNKFGRRLFEIFFKSYTEKVWGISCREISVDWAAQRIKGLSLWVAIRHAVFPSRLKVESEGFAKSLLSTFRYPRRGPGMFWEAASEKIKRDGGVFYMGCRMEGLEFDIQRERWIVRYRAQTKEKNSIEAAHVISSAPLREVISSLEPKCSVAKEAASLRYRDFILIALVLRDRELFQDNWIYIHDPLVKVGRIQNFKSWSPEMVGEPNKSCYGMEYFCFENDEFWSLSDENLIAVAKREITQLGLCAPEDILDGTVLRQPKAYPIYDENYQSIISSIRRELKEKYPNLHLVGRNGMHKYDNQDHAMMTAMLAVDNIVAGFPKYDVWKVNQDAEYIEGEV